MSKGHTWRWSVSMVFSLNNWKKILTIVFWEFFHVKLMDENGWAEFFFRIYIYYCLLVFCKWKTRQNENFYKSFGCSICSLKWFAKGDFHLKIKFVLSNQHFYKHSSQIPTKPRIKWRQKKKIYYEKSAQKHQS